MTRTALIQMESFALLHVAYTQLVIIWQFEKECIFEIIKALQCGAVPRCSSWPRVQPTVIAGWILHWISPVIKRAPSLPPSGESVLWHSPGSPLSPCEWNYLFKEQCPQAAERKSPTLGCQSYQKCTLTWHPSHSAQWAELEEDRMEQFWLVGEVVEHGLVPQDPVPRHSFCRWSADFGTGISFGVVGIPGEELKPLSVASQCLSRPITKSTLDYQLNNVLSAYRNRCCTPII